MLDATNDRLITVLVSASLSVGVAYGIAKARINGLREQVKKKADREVVEVHMKYIKAELKEIKAHLKGE